MDFVSQLLPVTSSLIFLVNHLEHSQASMVRRSSQMASSIQASLAVTPCGILGLPPEIWIRVFELLFAGSQIITTVPNIWRWKVRNRAILQVCRRFRIKGGVELYRHIQLIVSLADDPTRVDALPPQFRQKLQRIELVEGKLDETRAAPNLALFPALRQVIILSNHRADSAIPTRYQTVAMDKQSLTRKVNEHGFLLDRMQAKTQEIRQRQGWVHTMLQSSNRKFEVMLEGTLWISGRCPSEPGTQKNGEVALLRLVCCITSLFRPPLVY